MASKKAKKRGGSRPSNEQVNTVIKEIAKAADVRTHELKSWPSQFAATVAALKPFEIRYNDRGFLVGERILLREWQPLDAGSSIGQYTGRDILLEIVRVDAGFFGLRDGVVAMTVKFVEVPAT